MKHAAVTADVAKKKKYQENALQSQTAELVSIKSIQLHIPPSRLSFNTEK